jgi:hypothetical protein
LTDFVLLVNTQAFISKQHTNGGTSCLHKAAD